MEPPIRPTADSPDEARRLDALHRLGILDTPAEALLDSLVRSAAAACATPMAMLALIDDRRQWVKSQVGLDGYGDLPRAEALCALVLETGDYLEILDARADPRVAAQ